MILDEVYKYHNDWINIASTLVGDFAPDLVNDLYVTLIDRGVKLENIKYGDEVNKLFIYRMLRNLCLDYLRKESRMKLCELRTDIQYLELSEEEKALDKLYTKIEGIMENWHWYNRRVFEIYMFTGLSLRDISSGSDKEIKRIAVDDYIKPAAIKRGLNIHYGSLWSTIDWCKSEIREELKEDYKNFLNKDYERI